MKFKSCFLSMAMVSGLATSLFSQQQPDTTFGWTKQVIGNLNVTQASFDNWTAGGENTFAWQVSLRSAFLLDMPAYSWETTGKFALGFAKIEGNEARKSADELDIETIYTRKMSQYLNPFVSATAKTQFISSYNYENDPKIKISKFLDPGYFTQSLGMGYTYSPEFKTRLGGTLKETITSDFPVPFADDADTPEIEKTRVEVGVSSITDFKKKFHDNILLVSRLDLFSNFAAFDKIDVSWENDLTLKVTKYINVNFEFDLLYDKDISSKRQIKQVLSVGLTYAFL